MGLTLISAPAETPVSLDTVKQQVRVTGSGRNELLTLYLAAATDEIERWTGRALIDQTWDVTWDAFPADGGWLEIPKPPLIELVGLWYTDGDDAEVEVVAGDLIVDASRQPARIYPASGTWATPRDGAASVRARFRAGYLDTGVSPQASNVPASLQVAVLIRVGDYYRNPESIVTGDSAAELPNYLKPMLRLFNVNLGMA